MPEDQFIASPAIRQNSFIAIRVRMVLHVLPQKNKPTGPDGISGRILKELASALPYPLTGAAHLLGVPLVSVEAVLI